MEDFKHVRFSEKDYSKFTIKISLYYTDDKVSLILLIYNKKMDSYYIRHFSNEQKLIKYVNDNFVDKK